MDSAIWAIVVLVLAWIVVRVVVRLGRGQQLLDIVSSDPLGPTDQEFEKAQAVLLEAFDESGVFKSKLPEAVLHIRRGGMK